MQQQNRDPNNEGSNENETKIYLTPDSSLQMPQEDRGDKSRDPRENSTFEVSSDDLHQTNADRLAGSDRAGTAERKNNEMESSKQ